VERTSAEGEVGCLTNEVRVDVSPSVARAVRLGIQGLVVHHLRQRDGLAVGVVRVGVVGVGELRAKVEGVDGAAGVGDGGDVLAGSADAQGQLLVEERSDLQSELQKQRLVNWFSNYCSLKTYGNSDVGDGRQAATSIGGTVDEVVLDLLADELDGSSVERARQLHLLDTNYKCQELETHEPALRTSNYYLIV
jgi:hypothetical protein